MSEKSLQQPITIPEGIEVSLAEKRVTVKGPLGEVTKDFSHAPTSIVEKNGEIVVSVLKPNKKNLAIMGTVASLIRNMITGVTKGFTYRMKVIFSHFPITVKVEGQTVLIENFIGEKFLRRATIVGSTRVKPKGEEVVVYGIDKNDVGQTAANIERAVTIPRKDPRKFLDGIYIYDKSEGVPD
ncbi:MAG: 50S ribosomal protein L6 [Aigarchaeota archaeon]|nr:50S ribosomal protein L6 [Aigarchaeota archaeon]